MDSQDPIITSQSPVHHLNRIKEIIDSIHHEDTAALSQSMKKELDCLSKINKQDKPINALLKIIRATGKYLLNPKDKRPRAEALPLFKSLLKGIETLVCRTDLNDSEKNQILSNELKKFNIFKKKISILKTSREEISELKTILLSMDWEINDQTMKIFKIKIKALKSQWKNDKLRTSFLNIIQALGNYICTQKAQAHAETISFMHSVFKNLELIDQRLDMPYLEQKKILHTDIHRFHEFKKKIAETSKKRLSRKKRADSPPHGNDKTDSILQPALSHLKHAPRQAKNTDDFIPLVLLPSDSGDSNNKNELNFFQSTPKKPPGEQQAAAKKPAPPRDIMGDLFSPKESEMDELLEDIHRLNFNKTDPPYKANTQREENNSMPPGMQKFIPSRLDVEPIPEIENRLDEFFDSPLSEDLKNVKDHAPEANMDGETMLPPENENLEPITDSEATEKSTESKEPAWPERGMAPGHNEYRNSSDYDISVGVSCKIDKTEEPNLDNLSLQFLKEIYSCLEKPNHHDIEMIQNISKNIIQLEQIWSDGSEKKIITQIFHAFNQLLEKIMEERSTSITSEKKIKKSGIWSKIQSLLSSGETKA